MKKIISTLIIMTISLILLPQAMADLNDGLVAYWPFNGNANDESGNGNHGTVYGAMLCQDRLGNKNSAYCFDGVDDYIDIGNDSSIKPDLPLTLSAWIFPKGLGGWMWILSNDKAYPPYPYYGALIALTPSNIIEVSYTDGGSGGAGSRRTKFGTTALTPNSWYYVAAVINGPVDIEIYLNGENDGGNYDGSGGNLKYSSSPGFIGQSGHNNGFFNGTIDDVRIYKRALLENEIKKLYQEDIKDLVYTPVTPCRIVDTRKAGGAIAAGGIRSYNVWGPVASQGGNPAGCPSPKGKPLAVHVNVTSVPLGNGWITAYPFGSAAPTASLVNYRSDAQNVANSGTIKTCFNCAKDISIKSGGGKTHVIIDVLGYYYSKP